jgi:hypothetical protein
MAFLLQNVKLAASSSTSPGQRVKAVMRIKVVMSLRLFRQLNTGD